MSAFGIRGDQLSAGVYLRDAMRSFSIPFSRPAGRLPASPSGDPAGLLASVAQKDRRPARGRPRPGEFAGGDPAGGATSTQQANQIEPAERGGGAKSLGQIPARSVQKSVQSFREILVTAPGGGSCRSVSTSRRSRLDRVVRGQGAARRRGGIAAGPLRPPVKGQRRLSCPRWRRLGGYRRPP